MAARQGFIQLRSSKEVIKPKVRIFPAANGLGNSYCMLAEDNFKLTKEPMGWLPFAYVWATEPGRMVSVLEKYLELKGIRTGDLA